MSNQKPIFKHIRKTRDQAMQMLVVAVGFPLTVWLLIHFVIEDGVWSDGELAIARYASIAIGIFVFLFLSLPKFRLNSTFRFIVTPEYVTCEWPNQESYTIEVSSIEELRQVKYSAGDMVEEYIITNDGQSYKIPYDYNLCHRKAKKALQKAKPEITRKNNVTY